MLLIGSDFINTSGSFDSLMKARDGGRLYVRSYATSGVVANTPMAIQWAGSGYSATILAAGIYAYVGVPEDGAAISSGSVGWMQIRGPASDVQASAAEWKGSVGHSVRWEVGTLGASTSANQGNPQIGQVGVLLEETSASTTANIFLTGAWATPIA